MADNDPKAPLPVGTTLVLVDVRSPQRDLYAGIINGIDPTSKLPLVTRFNRTSIGRRDIPAEAIGHPVRFDDGTPPAGLEQFRIISITGSPDMSEVVTSLLARVESFTRDHDASTRATVERLSLLEKRLSAVAETIGQPSVSGDSIASAIRKALHTGITVPIHEGRIVESIATPVTPAVHRADADADEDITHSSDSGADDAAEDGELVAAGEAEGDKPARAKKRK